MNNYTIISSCEGTRNIYLHPKSYEDKAIRLAKSIRSSDKNVSIIMWYGEDKIPSNQTLDVLSNLNCKLVQGKCLFANHPLFNKIEAMSVPVTTQYKLWIDTDIYIKNGLNYFDNIDCDVAAASDAYSHHVMTKIEDQSIWQDYYKLVGLDLDVPIIETSIDKKPGNFYFNTGVIYINNNLCELYKLYSQKVLESDLPYSKSYYDAIGLTLAILKTNSKYIILPEEYNYIYALRRNTNGNFIHYQDNILDIELEWDISNLINV